MKEDFLHYVWKYQKIDTLHLATVTGETVLVIHPGQHNYNSGPDFFNAQVKIDGQLWAGNVEIHLKSSDWYAHGHEADPAYDNTILHVVWEHDTEVYSKNQKPIDTLELKDVVDNSALKKYRYLFSAQQRWINCERQYSSVDPFVLQNWLERLYLERLQQKSEVILKLLEQNNNHWEAVLFQMLAKNFGLKVNGESFFSIASSVPFSIVQKCRYILEDLEALLYGQAGLLPEPTTDAYVANLQQKYTYLAHKFKLDNSTVIAPKFFRLRPPNFPTIRLSQLAMLYHGNTHLFSAIIEAGTKETFYGILRCKASSYWDTHYNFGVEGSKRAKKLTNNFMDLLLINTILPIKFCYAQGMGKDISETLLQLTASVQKEENTIVKRFNKLKPMANNAMDSQALLQLKKYYCDQNKCLDCAVGNSILKN
ncbi:DUF2851 family protein [Marinirhabdus gelatinilytica]|uniref:Uncharacterized protein DUF2851 n=1 Tax=Marinirhabdus gelatinilytica TaxID=1703343 RepID=A0A370Q916_9FLAO|nr:DUF2851 family protein [Marinirhabdus gelatinilytica]RDK84862.1 uncharacterized protein DUF2851 [Marinirhabdus gelatinilytica]